MGRALLLHKKQSHAWQSWVQGTPTNLTAMLTGDQVVPPVNTSANGSVEFTVHHYKHHKDDSATYTISLYGVNHLEIVDMHQAHEGHVGDRVATLWGPSPHGLDNVSP